MQFPWQSDHSVTSCPGFENHLCISETSRESFQSKKLPLGENDTLMLTATEPAMV